MADAVGLVFLSSFIMNTGLLWFFMRASVICNFRDSGLVYVECGRSPAAKFLEIFFLYFSPLVVQIIKGNTNRVLYMPEPLSDLEFWPVVIFFVVSWFIILCSILTLRKMLRGFIRRRRHPQGLKHSWLMLAVLLTPALVSYSVRLYIIPPKFISRDIHVDIWHGAFDVPRNLLDDWSLVTPDRLPAKPDDYASALTRKWKWVPFVEFDFPDNVPLQTKSGASAVHVNPHYWALDEKGLQQERDRIAGLRLGKVMAESNLPAYAPVTEVRQEWEIHKPSAETDDFFADIYLWRDEQGNIQRILECTPDKYCATVRPMKWVNNYCGVEEKCTTCQKICVDRSQGAGDYDVVYSFDKKYLGRFEEIHTKILDYVAQFYTPKNP